MRDILDDVEKWIEGHEKIALATVVETWGSSPRVAGAKMAMTADGKITGSVSGGCVEGAVFESGVETLRSGKAQLLHFGVADETAWQVGLACGGQVDVFVQALDEGIFDQLRESLRAGEALVSATVIRGPAELMGWQRLVLPGQALQVKQPTELDEMVREKAGQVMKAKRSQTLPVELSAGERLDVFFEVIEPQPTLVMVGGVHIAIALAKLARTLGFRTVVVDPRKAFGNTARFPDVDVLIQEWPQEAFTRLKMNEKTAVAVLTHDPKIDDPALSMVLQSQAFYVGALGSPTTQAKRRARLLEAGFSEDQLSRLHGPIGLKLGGQTPEEIALAVMAEIVATRHGAMAESRARDMLPA
jgi:xanthine dehydrogenase accessory factor